MKVLQDRLQLEIEEHIHKIKRVHQDYINAPQKVIVTDKQVIKKLEDGNAKKSLLLRADSFFYYY